MMSIRGLKGRGPPRPVRFECVVGVRSTASQLAELMAQGVAPEVIDSMQQTYLDAVKRDASYENWHHWSRYNDYWYGVRLMAGPMDNRIGYGNANTAIAESRTGKG